MLMRQNVDWVEPIDDSKEAKDMAQMTLDYVLGMVSPLPPSWRMYVARS